MKRQGALYVDFPKVDDTAISVIPCIVEEPVESHCHTYYEFAIVTRGSCMFEYRGVCSLLIPGDVFLIQPHELHSYDVQAPAMITNCHFFPEELGAECNQSLQSATTRVQPQGLEDVKKQWDELLRYVTLQENVAENRGRQAELETQGVIHLTPNEMEQVEELLDKMIQEQDEQEEGVEYTKSAYLQLILIFFKRVKNREHQRMQHYTSQKKTMIYEAITYIEDHLTEKINFAQIAENIYLSPNYF